MANEPIQYKFERFEGPLELLLTLVTKHKMKIEDIPIDLLCEQYMAYIGEASRRDIDLACEFLSMASELMLIKSRMLLPRTPENAEDPRTPLVNALLEYQKAKLAAAELGGRYAEYGDRMAKEPDDVSPDKTYVAPHHVEFLRAALRRVLTEAKGADVNPEKVKAEFETIVNAPRIPVETVISGLIGRLRTAEPLYLDGYFVPTDTKSTLIAKFIGLLELLKSHVISLDDAPSEDGVTDMRAHVKISLLADAEKVEMSAAEWE